VSSSKVRGSSTLRFPPWLRWSEPTQSRSPIYGRCASIPVICTITANGARGAAAEHAEAGDIGVTIASGALGKAGDGGDQDRSEYEAYDAKGSELDALPPIEALALGIIEELSEFLD
jgi:hypothetical protein